MFCILGLMFRVFDLGVESKLLPSYDLPKLEDKIKKAGQRAGIPSSRRLRLPRGAGGAPVKAEAVLQLRID